MSPVKSPFLILLLFGNLVLLFLCGKLRSVIPFKGERRVMWFRCCHQSGIMPLMIRKKYWSDVIRT